MPTIAFLNKKGGVGKTSSCHHLSGALAQAGLRVLLVDNDPQASLTQGFWGPGGALAVPPAASVMALYDPAADPIPAALVRATGVERVDLVPGSDALTPFNRSDAESWGPYQFGMRDFLREVSPDYDLVLIDCPPNLHLCSWAALVAADAVVVPLQPEDYGAQGIPAVQAAVRTVQAGPNPSLRLLGYLLTMYDRRLAIHQAYETTLRAQYGSDVFEHPVPDAKDFKEAVAARKPITLYKPRSAAAKATAAVAQELLDRAAGRHEEGADDDAGRRVA